MKIRPPYTFNGKIPIRDINKNAFSSNGIPPFRALDFYSNQGMFFSNLKGILDYRFFSKNPCFQVLENDSTYIFNFFIVFGFSTSRMQSCPSSSQTINNLAFEGFFYIKTFNDKVKISKSDSEIVFSLDYQYSVESQLPNSLCGFSFNLCLDWEYPFNVFGNGRSTILRVENWAVNTTTFLRANSNNSKDCETTTKSGYAPIGPLDLTFCSPSPGTYVNFNSCNLILRYNSGLSVSSPCSIGCTSRLVDRWG